MNYIEELAYQVLKTLVFSVIGIIGAARLVYEIGRHCLGKNEVL